MKDKVLLHAGKLLGGFVHNLNTPLMWVMGRSQLLEARNGMLSPDAPAEQLAMIREKNLKDITSISEGAERIDGIIKSVGYKIQMANEGFASLELKDYLEKETAFLMADMRFKHETRLETNLEQAVSCYLKIDYNALSWAVVESINTILDHTENGRTLRISLEPGGVIRLVCPELEVTEAVEARINDAAAGLDSAGRVEVDAREGISLIIKGA